MMATWIAWRDFAEAAPDLANFGRRRLRAGVAYLGTARGAGLPRVHPVQPIVSEQRLMSFMFPTSPKAHDLRRDGRYALHSMVADTSGTGGEFMVRGMARLVDDAAVRTEAAEAGFRPRDEYILFELSITHALATEYVDGEPRYRRWDRAG